MSTRIFNPPNDPKLPQSTAALRRTTLLLLALACGGDGPTAPAPPEPALVADVRFDVAAVALYVGQTRTVTAIKRDAAGGVIAGRSVSWSSSEPGIANVSTVGVVTAIAPGSASVFATIDGKTAALPVSVSLVPVKQVSIAIPSGSLYVGSSVSATATAADSAGNPLSGRTVAWSTSSATVLTVTSGGVVTAVAPGTADVIAEVEGVRATATITVSLVPVATVTVSPSSASLYVAQTADLNASPKDSAGNTLTGRVVTWSTSEAAVATVSATGIVTAVAPGAATVTATVEGKTAAVTITVSLVPVATVTVTPSTAILYLGQTVDLGATAKDSAGNTLTGRAIAWSSSNTAIATVSSTGIVTAVAAGSATITATVEAKTGTGVITAAVVPVATVMLSAGDATLYQTATLDYDASAADSAGNSLTGRAVTWTSGNTSIATVSATGLVTALAQGEATITATVEGKTASATITVRHDPIVFVHGFGSNSSVWSTMTGRFAADGWRSADFVSWSYNSLQSNVATASALKTTIDSLLVATGAKRVDVITHSMGGLPSGYYLKNLDGTKVDAWVSLGGPNHGTDTADLCAGTYVSCTEMQIGSGFLTALNSSDETPGTSRYATWWSPCDATINPDDSVPLSGATNTQTACLGHSALYSDETVYGQVKSWIR